MRKTIPGCGKNVSSAHTDWYAQNRELLIEANLLWTKEVNDGAALLYRGAGRPFADFYPHTGRWKACETGKIYRGGAVAFIKWAGGRTQPAES